MPSGARGGILIMPGQIFLILRAVHPMVGRDLHIPWPPGAPAPLPAPAPYMTASLMMGTGITSKYTTDVFADSMIPVMCKGTDIGPMIPHIGPPSTTLMIEILTSGSKSHFGPSYYQVTDQTKASGNPAVALLGGTNPNLNCGYPIPTPFGMVLALTTHGLGMSWGDIVGGLYQMALDFMLQAILQKLGGDLGSWLGKGVSAFAREMGIGALLAVPALERLLGAEAGPILERFAGAAETIAATAVGQFVGTPLGTTSANFGLPGILDTANPVLSDYASGDKFGAAFDNYLNSPSVEDANQPAPPPSDTQLDGGLPPGGVPEEPAGPAADPADAGAPAGGLPGGSGDPQTGGDSGP